MADELADDRPTELDGEGASGSPRLAAPADDAPAPRLPFPVVGVGASAGGLEAYSELLDALPADTGAAFVLVQHLPPDRESLLTELLARHTRMPVLPVDDGMPVEPDHVYVIRPGHTLTLADGRLRLGASLAARGHGRPVDDFFRSLAAEQQQRAVAVVLSGMGSNGTAGAATVKAVGGLVIAQEPESAKYPSMPRSLVDAHLADYILRPAEMPDAILRFARHPYTAGAAGRDRQVLADILAVLRTRGRQDFSGYRTGTLVRRVQRRMGLTQAAGMGEYARHLRQTPAEVSALADDLLIHVTGFFRDPEAWAALRTKVIDPLTADRPDGGAVRAWVAACATGEEAYTLAMLLLEAAEDQGKRLDVKVFATDMAERALGHARAGVFPNGIESEVTAERLARFFDKDDAFYRVKKELREAVIFAPQNVLQDPPFSRLDIATCRNLLIYLEPDTQRRVLALLHFGLRDGGALLLGTSESTSTAEGTDFEPIDKRHRLYRRIGPTRHGVLDFPLPYLKADPHRAAPTRLPARPPLAQAADRLLLDHFSPAAVVADAAGQVLYFHGNTNRYLRQPPGEPTRDLFVLAHEQVRGAVRTALHRAAGRDRPVVVRDGLLDTPDGRRRIEVAAVPLDRPPDPAHYLITFADHPDPPPAPPLDPDATAEARLIDELGRVRDELQSTVEELQSTNEELKASHEEVTSVNEELQSTNEELETSKEELQSLNEELVTVNAQLQTKMAELEATSNDLGSLLTSTDIAVLFLDPRFRIRRFTPATQDLLDLIPSDIGRPLADLRRKFTDPHLLADAAAVLERLQPVEREVASDSGRAYLRRALPYRTADNRIDGVVVAFVDVTERKAVEAARRESDEKYRTLFTAIDEGFCVIEVLPDPVGGPPDYRYLEVNPAFETHTGLADPVGRRMREIAPDHEEFWFRTYARVAETGEPRRFQHVAAAFGRHFDVYAFRLGPADRRRVAVLFTDISERKRIEAAKAVAAGRDAFRVILGDALRPLVDPLAAQIGAAGLLATHLLADRAFYAAIGPDEDEIVVAADARGDGVASVAGRHRLTAFGRHASDTLRSGRTLVYPDLAGVPDLSADERAAYRRLGIASLLKVPLVKGGRLVAFLGVHSTTPRAWTADEVTLTEEVAERTWAAVERARAEAAVRERDEQLALAQRAAGLGVSSLDLNTLTGITTPEWRDVVGLPDPPAPQDFDAFLRQVHPHDRERVAALHAEPPGPDGLECEFRVRHPVRGERWVLSRSRLLAFPGGPGRLVGIALDITDRRKAEDARREGAALARAVAANLPSAAVFVVDPDLRYVLAAGDALAASGNTPADIEGRSLAAVLPPDLFAAYEPNYRAVLAGDTFHTEHEAHGRHYVTHGAPLRDADGRVTAALAVSYDITDRKRAEDAVRQARDELEQRVRERTADLATTLTNLHAEVAERQALLARLETAQEDERRRVARELHDGLGQYLAALSIGLATARDAAEGPEADQLDRMAELAADAGREAHRLAIELRPTALDDLGLRAAVQQHVERWTERTGVSAEFGSRGLDGEKFPGPVATALYRVVQEALTNVLRHAKANRVSVLLDRGSDYLSAIVEDDGGGFDPDRPSSGRSVGGLGLPGIRERLALIGGTVHIESAPGSGTTVFVRVPVPPAEEQP